MCRGEIIKGEIVTVIRDIQTLKQGFSFCGFSWVSRKSNELAHNIAHLASKNALPPSWVFNWPFVIKEIILRDKDRSRFDPYAAATPWTSP